MVFFRKGEAISLFCRKTGKGELEIHLSARGIICGRKYRYSLQEDLRRGGYNREKAGYLFFKNCDLI